MKLSNIKLYNVIFVYFHVHLDYGNDSV